jgi:hypothetical protein
MTRNYMSRRRRVIVYNKRNLSTSYWKTKKQVARESCTYKKKKEDD